MKSFHIMHMWISNQNAAYFNLALLVCNSPSKPQDAIVFNGHEYTGMAKGSNTFIEFEQSDIPWS